MKNWFGKIKDMLMSMSKQQKIIAAVAAVVVVGGGTGLAIWTTHKPAAEPTVAKEKKEVLEPSVVVEEDSVNFNMTGESLEKDLKVIFKDDSDAAITGTTFGIVVLPAKDDKSIDTWTAKLTELEEKYPILK